MTEFSGRTARSDEYAYRLRYLDEDAWETVGVDTVRRALAEAYHDVGMALEFLHEAGGFARQPPCMRPSPFDPTSTETLAWRSHNGEGWLTGRKAAYGAGQRHSAPTGSVAPQPDPRERARRNAVDHRWPDQVGLCFTARAGAWRWTWRIRGWAGRAVPAA